MHPGAAQYRKLDTQTAVSNASPHRLIQLMFEGGLNRLRVAHGQLENGNLQGKCTSISSALEIIGALQGCLDQDRGGELARNLDQLYHYMQYRLFRANVDNDPHGLAEVIGLLDQIKTAWDAIADRVPAATPVRH